MSGFKKGSRVWIHKGKERKLMPQVTITDRVLIQLALATGWKLGSGSKGTITRAPQVSVKTKEGFHYQKWIPKDKVKEWLQNNKEWTYGYSKDGYNKGRKNPGYGGKRRGYHFSSPRPHLIGSKRLWNPQDPNEKGRYIKDPLEIQRLLKEGWIFGLRLKPENQKQECPRCHRMITPQQLNNNHKDSQYCRQTEKKLLIDEMFQSQDDFDTKTGYSKSFSILGHPLYPRYKELLESLKP